MHLFIKKALIIVFALVIVQLALSQQKEIGGIDDDLIFIPNGIVTINGNIFELSSFYIAKYEVTKKQYRIITGKDPSKLEYGKTRRNNANELEAISIKKQKYGVSISDNSDNCAVENINWYEAIVFCNLMSLKNNYDPTYSIDGETDPNKWGNIPLPDIKAKHGVRKLDNNDLKWNSIKCDFSKNGYRLPTETEWIWAALGAENKIYKRFAGDNGYNDAIKYAQYHVEAINESSLWPYLVDVGNYEPNELGIFDMSGSVSEWCWDWYNEFPNQDIKNYEGPIDSKKDDGVTNTMWKGFWGNETGFKILKGGNWASYLDSLSPSNRNQYYPPYNKDYDTGFRIVRTKK